MGFIDLKLRMVDGDRKVFLIAKIWFILLGSIRFHSKNITASIQMGFHLGKISIILRAANFPFSSINFLGVLSPIS